MTWVLFGLAWAQEPLPALPERPEPPVSVPGHCIEAVGLQEGAEAPCTGTLLPPSDLADLLATEAWAEAIEARYRTDTAYLQWHVNQAQLERDWWRARAEEMAALQSEPEPWHLRPGAQRAMGAATVILSVGVTGLMLHGIGSL